MAGSNDRNDDRSLDRLNDRLERFAQYMEKMKLAEYVDLLHNPRRLLYVNFISGVARGLGMAVGFTFLGAVVIYVLTRLLTRTFVANLPVMGGIIAQIVRIVQVQLTR